MGSIHGGTAQNIIPEEVKIRGIIRSMSKEDRAFVKERLKNIVRGICKSYRGRADIKIEESYPNLYNDEKLLDIFISSAEKIIGKESREPNITDISKELGISKEHVVMALDAIQEPISLFESVYHDGGDAIFVMDQVKDNKNNDEKWLESISISEAMSKLSEREKRIVDLRFFQGRTQMEVADEIGISQAQVSRLEKSALKHMQKYV